MSSVHIPESMESIDCLGAEFSCGCQEKLTFLSVMIVLFFVV